jgi:hypothetical protein
LTIDQYQTLLKAVPEINASLKSMGIDVSANAADLGEDSEEEAKPQKRIKPKKETKSNIEATSEEEEDE